MTRNTINIAQKYFPDHNRLNVYVGGGWRATTSGMDRTFPSNFLFLTFLQAIIIECNLAKQQRPEFFGLSTSHPRRLGRWADSVCKRPVVASSQHPRLHAINTGLYGQQQSQSYSINLPPSPILLVEDPFSSKGILNI